MIFLYLLFFIFLFSLQAIQSAFFCDDYLREINVIKGNIKIRIANERYVSPDTPYFFNISNAAPGDLIELICHNSGGDTFGGVCFLLHNECYCNDFDTKLPLNYRSSLTVTVHFPSKSCSFNIHYLYEFNMQKDYNYEYYIPLDATKISSLIIIML